MNVYEARGDKETRDVHAALRFARPQVAQGGDALTLHPHIRPAQGGSCAIYDRATEKEQIERHVIHVPRLSPLWR